MKSLFLISTTLFYMLISGCSSRTVPDLPDAWQPANSFDDTPHVIALFRPYLYRVLSVDRTLMQLSRRWAKDTQIGSDYRCDDDFSLPVKLEGKSYREVNEAIQAINEIYESFGVTFTLSAKNELTTTCVNRDVVTGVARLKRSDKLDLIKKTDKTLQSQDQTRAIE